MPTVVGPMTRGAAFNYVVELNALGASAPTAATLSSDRLTLTAYTSTYIVASESSTTDDIDGISGWNENMFILLRAAVGHTLTLKDENAGAASTSDRIRLPGGTDVSFTDDEVAFLWHDDTLDRWILISGPSGGGALAAHLADAADAHDASAVSVVPTGSISSTEVQAAIAELDGDVQDVDDALQAHVSEAVDAHDASAISNVAAGTVAATTVQAAIDELAADYAVADSTHVGAADPHTGYRLEFADHSHASTGAQGGTLPLYQLVTRTRTLVLTAAGIMPTTTVGCASPQRVEMGTNDRDVWFADFDQSTQEYGFWQVVIPDWDLSTVTYKVHWAANSTNADNVIWGVQAISNGDGEVLEVAYGTTVEVTDTNGGTTAYKSMITAASGALTVGGTPAAGDLVTFRIYRKAADGGDTLGADARLMAVVISYGGA